MRIFLIMAALLAAAGCDRSAQNDASPVATAGPVKGVDRSKAGTRAPDAELRNAAGEAASLAGESGPVLVNLWATWCAPCVKELPTLEALEARPDSPRVIAVSQDMAPRTSVDAFLEKHGLDLEVWHDPDMALSTALDTQVLPTTILYDSEGREVWRYVGDLDWSGEEAARLLGEARSDAVG